MTAPIVNLAIALLHYPVYNKHREIVTTALTNLDLHDIARASRTFGLDRYYIVTPSADQRDMALRIAGHWQDGWGATYNTDRKEALEIVRVCESLKAAITDFQASFSEPVKTVITGAMQRPGSIDCAALSRMLADDTTPYLLLLGTGWGLTDQVFDEADYILEPIAGTGQYNHLSVRSAAAILLDRLRGTR